MASLRGLKIVALAFGMTGGPAMALSNFSVTAPANVFVPTDNLLYQIPITVSVKLNAADATGGTSFSMFWQDTLPFGIGTDGLLDGVGFNIPAGKFAAGDTVGGTINLSVGGSNNVVGGETFGPMTRGTGTTGNSVSLCEFVFPGQGPAVLGVPSNLYYGTNRVECIAANLPATYSAVPTTMNPLNPQPGDYSPPYYPPPRFTDSSFSVVPEPSSIGLLGILSCTLICGRRRLTAEVM